MPRILAALALFCALASPVVAVQRQSTCMAVMVEFIPVNICARPSRSARPRP